MCRGCLSCWNKEHHWVPGPDDDELREWECKHCGAIGAMCGQCWGDGDGFDGEFCEECWGEGVVHVAGGTQGP